MNETNTQMNKANRTPEPWEIDRGGPAFPVSQDCTGPESAGMDLRDYFAAKAMQGMVPDIDRMANECARECGITYRASFEDAAVECARRAYAIADAMLAARPAK